MQEAHRRAAEQQQLRRALPPDVAENNEKATSVLPSGIQSELWSTPAVLLDSQRKPAINQGR
jgi:hypothetical protein